MLSIRVIPALKKDTVTLIDDREPHRDSEHLQLSNFSLLEDRETGQLEMYMTRFREKGGDRDVWCADCWKYTLTLR